MIRIADTKVQFEPAIGTCAWAGKAAARLSRALRFISTETAEAHDSTVKDWDLNNGDWSADARIAGTTERRRVGKTSVVG